MKAGTRLFVDEVRSGSSYDSNNDMRVHFGLGSVTKLDTTRVRWPSGLVEQFDNLHSTRFTRFRKAPAHSLSLSRKSSWPLFR